MVKMCPTAIVLAFDINGLGVVRSLAKKSIKTITICSKSSDPSNYSKYPFQKKLFEYKGDYHPALLDILSGINGINNVLIPTSDETVEFIDKNRSQLEKKFKLAVPSSNVITSLIDKKREIEKIRNIGIPCPNTILDVDRSILDDGVITKYPIIIKPRTYKDCSIIKKKNIVIDSSSELEIFVNKYNKSLNRFIIQEVIVGEDSNQWVCNCVYDKSSNLISVFTFQRLHLSPAHYGVTSMARSEVNPTIIEYAKSIGKSLNYIGPAMIEFKYDNSDYTYMYIELNPRIGMCNYFDTTCGINNVYNSYCVAIGENIIDKNLNQKENIYFFSLYDDLYSRYKDGCSLGSILLIYLRLIFKRKAWAYFDFNDLMPFIFNIKSIITK